MCRVPLRHLWPGALALVAPALLGLQLTATPGGSEAFGLLLVAGLLGLALYGSPRRS